MSAISAPSDNLHLARIDRRSAHSALQTILVTPCHRYCQFSAVDSDGHQDTHLPLTMGWMKAVRNNAIEANLSPDSLSRTKELNSDGNKHAAIHIEDTGLTAHVSNQQLQSLPLAHPHTPSHELPFLPASQLALLSNGCNGTSATPLYLVIDDIVYDCTRFVHEHTGGPHVIESFRGQDCSWQFWRFHSKENMREWGQLLRIARTHGVKNRWKERPRFVGLRKFGAAVEDDW
jgi:cytochrome b involved in lipid metabolism